MRRPGTVAVIGRKRYEGDGAMTLQTSPTERDVAWIWRATSLPMRLDWSIQNRQRADHALRRQVLMMASTAFGMEYRPDAKPQFAMFEGAAAERRLSARQNANLALNPESDRFAPRPKVLWDASWRTGAGRPK